MGEVFSNLRQPPGPLRFSATSYPCSESLRALERLEPFSPFNTAAYAAARVALGEHPYVLAVDRGGSMVVGCLALMSGRWLARQLEIPSLPRLDEADIFVEGLRSFCRSHRVWDLEIGSFGSDGMKIPPVGLERRRRSRWEFVVDLSAPNFSLKMSTNHRRNVNKATKAGLWCRRTTDDEAAALHLGLVGASMARRQARGEVVALPANDSAIVSMLRSGAGEIFQAVCDDEVLSSILIVKSSDVGYYHSAGTTTLGMERGASPFLVREVALALKKDGLSEFNLGGAEPDNPGLYRFKGGFGAATRPLEAASFSMVSRIKRKVRAAVRLALKDPGQLARSLCR